MLTNKPQKSTRLVVILPESLAGDSDLGEKIQWIAIRDHCEVLCIVLRDHIDKSLALFNPHTEIGSVDTSMAVNYMSVISSNWGKVLRETVKPQDVIVCMAEQDVRKGLFSFVPLGEYVLTEYPNRVVQISGFYNPVREQLTHFFFQSIFLLGCLVILGAFTAFEIALDHTLSGVLRTTVLCAVVGCEFGILYKWNNLIEN